MVTLAEAFAQRNEAPPENLNDMPRPQPSQAAFTDNNTMNQTPPRHPGTPMRAASPAPSAQNSAPGSVGAPMSEVEFPDSDPPSTSGIPAPTSFSSHETFDCCTRRSSEFVLARALSHNAVVLVDLVFEWLTPRILKFRVAWPEFFLMAEQMAELTQDDSGDLIFPPNHALTMNMSRRNADCVEEDGKVWDEGTMAFEQDMKPDNPIIELADCNVASRKITVKLPQVHAE